MANLSDITILTVAFNSADAIRDMLQSVPSEVAIVIVDNGSHDIADLRSVAKQFDNAKLIEADQNLGFGQANNIAAQATNTQFLLIQNPDTPQFDDSYSYLRGDPVSWVSPGKTAEHLTHPRR